jgi:hypothetical protein
MHILDFGHFEMAEDGRLSAEPESGKLWRLPEVPVS